MKTEVSYWQFINILFAYSLFVYLKFHLVDLLNMVDGHYCFLIRDRRGCNTGSLLFLGSAIEEIIINRRLVLTKFVLHVEEGVVVGIFWIAAIFVLVAGAFVNIVKHVIRRYGLTFILIEAFIKQLFFRH